MNTTNLRHQLLTVHFSLSAWEARKQDKRATREVAVAHGTDTSVGRYHKDLLPGSVEHEAIIKLRNAWRVWHYENTLPWGDEGARVIRSSSFLDYGAGYRTRNALWDEAIEAFIDVYPQAVAQAELRLNTLFDRGDYPDADEVRRRFAVRMRTYPLPDAEDFRIIDGIPPEEADRLVAEALDGMNARINDAVRDLWKRMHTVVDNMNQKLSVPHGAKGSAFHDTLVSNIGELVELMPKLNLTGDPVIAKFGEEMALLAAHQPQALRTQPDVREATRLKAAELAQRMAQYIG